MLNIREMQSKPHEMPLQSYLDGYKKQTNKQITENKLLAKIQRNWTLVHWLWECIMVQSLWMVPQKAKQDYHTTQQFHC